MTVKEIYEKTVFGSLTPAWIEDYGVSYMGGSEMYLEAYKKAFRKNAAQKYRNIKALLDREAVVVRHDCIRKPIYYILTRRSFEGPFSEPLPEGEKIWME